MSDETTNGAVAPAEAAGPAFTVEKIYVKDVSFEVPGSPAIYGESTQPELNLNLNQRVQRLNENAFEVVLGVTLTCKAGEKVAYVAEVQQAGVFGLVGLEPQAVDGLLGTQCPNILFPAVLPAADQFRRPVRGNPAPARRTAGRWRRTGQRRASRQRLIQHRS